MFGPNDKIVFELIASVNGKEKKKKNTKISWAVINDALRFTPVGASLRQIFGLA